MSVTCVFDDFDDFDLLWATLPCSKRERPTNDSGIFLFKFQIMWRDTLR